MSRYARQMILPEVGTEGQARIRAARLLIVGAGGLGVPAVQYLAGAGVGRITLVDLQDNRAFVRLDGGCQGCGMADVTLKQGVAVEIQNLVPSITEVLDITDHADGTNPYYQPR